MEKNLPVENSPEIDWESRIGRIKAIRDWVVANMEEAHKIRTNYYNKRHREITYKEGDLVMQKQRVLSNNAKNIASKLVPKFRGALKIIKVISPLILVL